MKQRTKDIATGVAIGYGVGAAVEAVAVLEDEMSRKELNLAAIRKDPAQALEDFGIFLLVILVWPRLFLGYIREEL